ncbi:MAG: amidase [Lysinibacillus sp.]
MTELAFLSATELGELIKTKQLSPVELTKHLLNRIDQMDPTINAYITPLHESALKQAQEAEEAIMQGRYLGPLHGIPMGIKDNYQTKGIRTTGGSKLFRDSVPDKTATSVEKLLAAGGIMLGKLNMNELGAGSTGTNQLFGTTKNPWNVNHLPGGSSGGSGGALAAGMATLTTGTDTWGSNRIPAAMSGVYGLKPTYGLISTYGILPTAWSLDHPGPLARSVSDVALMLNAMAGFDVKDPASLNVPISDYTADLDKNIHGIKIGIPTYYMEGLEPEVERLFNSAVATLNELGAEVRGISIPELAMSTFAGFVISSGEAATFNCEMLKMQSAAYAQDTRALLLSGTLTTATQYLKAQQARRRLAKAFQKAFDEVDVILGPTIPITAPEIGENWAEQNLAVTARCLPFTVPANLTGVPSLSVPIGLSADGLPVGMQFMGKHLSEQQLFQIGAAWERTKPVSYPSSRI